MCIYSLSGIYSSRLTMPTPRAKEHLTPPSQTRHRNPHLSCWSGFSKSLPKYYRLLLLMLVLQRCKVISYCWRHHALKKQGLEDPEMDLTWKLLKKESNQKAPCKLPKEGTNQSSFPDEIPRNHNSGQHDTITLRAQEKHAYLPWWWPTAL